MKTYLTPGEAAARTGLDEKTAAALLERACDEVDAICYGRIRKRGFDNLSSFQREKVQKAVCEHLLFLDEYGELLRLPLTHYGIDGVDMTFNGAKIECQGGVSTGAAVMAQLRQSGLAVRLIP